MNDHVADDALSSDELDAAREVFSALGVARAWLVASSDKSEVGFMVEGDDDQDLRLTRALMNVIPGRKVFVYVGFDSDVPAEEFYRA